MHHELQRQDRAMSAAETQQLLERGFSGALATKGEDGWPYVIQLSYALHEGKIYFHKSNRPGHMAQNLAFDSRVCFEVNEPGPVFPSGEAAQCETSVGFESLVVFGHCTLVTEPHDRLAGLHALMAKYADPSWVRPDVWPDMKDTAVYCIRIEKITGKRHPVNVAPKWQDQFPEYA